MRHTSSCKEAGWLTGITYDGRSLRTISERVPYPYIRVERTVFGNRWVLRINEADDLNEKKALAEKTKLVIYISVVVVIGTVIALIIATLFGGIKWRHTEEPYTPKLSVIYVNNSRDKEDSKDKEKILDTNTTTSTASPSTSTSMKPSTQTTTTPVPQVASVCQECNSSEVCLQNEGQLYPKCFKISDKGDPTGCGGLCVSGEQFCRLLDANLKILACLNIPGAKFDCGRDHFKCLGTRMCIPKKKRCDGIIDCFDRSDEKKCDCDLKTSFRCGGNLSCLPKRSLCDGSVDCWDASDEIFCRNGTKCQENEFPCRTGGCISREGLCDGFYDCGDQSDEPLGCKNVTSSR